jgi:hypothetical protein
MGASSPVWRRLARLLAPQRPDDTTVLHLGGDFHLFLLNIFDVGHVFEMLILCP